MNTDFEVVKCNFCSCNDTKTVYIKEGFNIVKCSKCGLVYVNPRLSSEAINKLYNDDYFTGKGFDKSVQYEAEFLTESEKITLSDWDVSTIKSFLKKQDSKNISLLDIGCGMGLFLFKAKKQNFKTLGLELSSFAVDFAISKGLNVQNNSIFSNSFKENSFDVISAKEVIEHLPDPKTALSIMHKLLLPGGLLFLTTGNYNCPERKLRGSNWFYFMPKGHIFIFSPKTIYNFLKEAGFSKIIVTNQGDLLMNFLLKFNIIEPDKYKPKNPFRRIIFEIVRFINHFISSGMRIYAIK